MNVICSFFACPKKRTKKRTPHLRNFGFAKPVLKLGGVLRMPEIPSFYSPILANEEVKRKNYL